jgi:hypothetical protein
VNDVAQKRLAMLIALLLPISSMAVLVWVPLPSLGFGMIDGRAWLGITSVAGALGIMILPWPWWWRVISIVLYIPVTFLLLAIFTLSLVCLVHGPHACP